MYSPMHQQAISCVVFNPPRTYVTSLSHSFNVTTEISKIFVGGMVDPIHGYFYPTHYGIRVCTQEFVVELVLSAVLLQTVDPFTTFQQTITTTITTTHTRVRCMITHSQIVTPDICLRYVRHDQMNFKASKRVAPGVDTPYTSKKDLLSMPKSQPHPFPSPSTPLKQSLVHVPHIPRSLPVTTPFQQLETNAQQQSVQYTSVQ